MRQPSAAAWRWTDWAGRLYEHAPAALEDAAKRCRPLVLPWCALRVPVVMLRGLSSHSGLTWSVLAAGTQAAIENISLQLFAGPPQREVVGLLPLWRVPSTLKRLGAAADLVLARMDRLSARLFFRTNYLVIPEGVGSRLTVPEDPDKMLCMNKRLKADRKRIRRGCFTVEVSHLEADFEIFYHTMYVPYLQRRHGHLAFIRNAHHLRRAFRRGGILWVRRDGQRIAGNLFQLRDDGLAVLGMGMIAEDLTVTKIGVSAALYFFLIKYARERRCTYIDYGGSPPDLTDGLLRYKRKWGAKLIAQPLTPYDYLMRWEQPSEQVNAYLAHRALIFRRHEQLAAVTALEPQSVVTPALIRKLQLSLSIPGLQRIFVLSPNWETDNAMCAQQILEQASTEEESKIVFCNLDHFLQECGGRG